MTGEKGKLDVNGWNTQRLAEVWMDEYKVIKEQLVEIRTIYKVLLKQNPSQLES